MGNVNSELREGSDNSQSSYCLYLFSSRNARLSSFSSIVNSQWGQSFVILRLGSTRNASYLWFIKLRGISPCPLYTPPVAFTNGPRCEIAGQVFTTSKVLNQGLLKEKEVVTRHQQVNLLMDHYNIYIYI